jgi:hypothetical protein
MHKQTVAKVRQGGRSRREGKDARVGAAGEDGALTLGGGKETEELRPRAERGREEGAMGTETMERVAIFALLEPRGEVGRAAASRIENLQGRGKTIRLCRLLLTRAWWAIGPCREGRKALFWSGKLSIHITPSLLFQIVA